MQYGNYGGGYADLLRKYRDVPRKSTTRQPVLQPTALSKPITPELEGLKHSTELQVPGELTQSFTQEKKPYSANIPVGLSEKERTGIFNVGRGRIQTATSIALEQMKERLGEKNLRPGDSGLADTILGKISMEGQKQLSEYGREVESQEAIRRFMEKLSLGKFGLQEQEMGLKKEGFEYGQEMEAIRLLMALFGMGQQGQATAYAPYWSSILGG